MVNVSHDIRQPSIILDTMSGHGHSHGAGGCDHNHDPLEDFSNAFNLYQKIDLERVECLNETREGSGKTVFKPWSERNDRSKVMQLSVNMHASTLKAIYIAPSEKLAFFHSFFCPGL